MLLHPRVADEAASSRAQILALISEIWMLVDYVAGNPTEGLSGIKVPDPRGAGAVLSPAEVFQAVSDVETRLAASATAQPGPNDRASMQIVRDALNIVASPASGLTVAYTTMVAGPLRRRSASRVNLAQDAYGNLAVRAFGHRYLQRAILVLAILATALAVWESAKVALGKALLQNLDLLRTEQAVIGSEKLKLELALGPTRNETGAGPIRLAGGPIPLSAYRLCDRALVARSRLPPADQPGWLAYDTPEERDICGRDDVLRAKLGIVRGNLRVYSQNWPGMVGSGFATTRNLIACWWPSCGDVADPSLVPGQNDVEFTIAPVLLVWGNFVLPVIFGLIGSAIFVTLDHYQKVHDSTLRPRDYFLAPVRLTLGLVVGACVGLFFSSYTPMQPTATEAVGSALIGALTLTASGVAFLAGFGVETVFSLLQSLIARVFTVPPPGKPG